MKTHLASFDPTKNGGGWTFAKYFAEHVGTYSYHEADTLFIAGATMVSYDTVEQAKRDGKKIVLRVDNHLLPSRNRNTGMSRLKAFAKLSDLVIYQSEWARDYLKNVISKDGAVILNGVDTEFFKPLEKNNEAVYIRSSRIAEKGWEMARYWYSRNRQEADYLHIVGKFSGENVQYNFDFINDEPFRFWGEQDRDFIATLLGKSKKFLYSYFMDACSNTLLEARAAGCEIVDVYGMLQTGGAPEIMACKDISIGRMVEEYENEMSRL